MIDSAKEVGIEGLEGGKKESSSKMSSLAVVYWKITGEALRARMNEMGDDAVAAEIRSISASVVSQDETPGS